MEYAFCLAVGALVWYQEYAQVPTQRGTMKQNALTPLEQAIVRMIADRVRHGTSLAAMSKSTGIPIPNLAKLARQAGIRYKHQHQSPEAIRRAVKLVVDGGLTVRAAASVSGLSKTAVHRFVVKQRRKVVDAAGPIKFEQSAQTGKRQKTWICPEHGKVTWWPCVICAAWAAKRK